MTTPLQGVRVIELARILAGPWAGQTLADLGAEVIKVEAPEGDDTRRWGPPFIDHDGERAPTLWDILADLAEARAASQPDAYRRDSRGRFKGGEEKGW